MAGQVCFLLESSPHTFLLFQSESRPTDPTAEVEKQRSEWKNPLFSDRERYGEFHTLFPHLIKQPAKFVEYFGMNYETFKYILTGIDIVVKPKGMESNFEVCISPEERLALTLRFMSTGIVFKSLSFLFRISHCDISKIIYETCIAIWEQFVLKHMPYLTEELLEQTAKEYENIRRYPNCVATISSIQFCNKCPKNSDLDDNSSNKLYYINLQGLVDSKYKFLSVEAVTNEHQNEGSFFLESALYKHLEEGTFPFPGPRPLPGTATKHPYVVVGDQRYPLKEYLMRPYTSGSEKISPTIEAFNIRHNQAKEAADRAFGILVAKWKCLKTGLQMDQQHVDTLVTTACLLHNIIIDKEGVMDANMLPNSVSVTKSSRSSVTRSQCRLKNYNRASQEAHKIRDIFKTYFKYHY